MNHSESHYQAILERNKTFDADFVYAVTSTGIYCLPSCASRKPKQENISIFKLPELAEQAGFRACKRCKPKRENLRDARVERIREMCRFIEQAETINLDELAQQFAMSSSYVQRSFKQVVGVSPQQYAEACRTRRFKTALQQGDDIAGASFEAGFGSSSQVYGKASQDLGMTPKTYQQGGTQMNIHYTITDSPLGKLLVAATERGICSVTLGDDDAYLRDTLKAEFYKAEIQHNDDALSDWVGEILEHLAGKQPHLDLPLDVRATAFQKQVWQALQKIPYGETRSYAQVAASLGKPTASRAVARACASNPTALVVPCHRVVRSDGSLSGYCWGVERKQQLLAQEQGKRFDVPQE